MIQTRFQAHCTATARTGLWFQHLGLGVKIGIIGDDWDKWPEWLVGKQSVAGQALSLTLLLLLHALYTIIQIIKRSRSRIILFGPRLHRDAIPTAQTPNPN
jgi:hypothetical protein